MSHSMLSRRGFAKKLVYTGVGAFFGGVASLEIDNKESAKTPLEQRKNDMAELIDMGFKPETLSGFDNEQLRALVKYHKERQPLSGVILGAAAGITFSLLQDINDQPDPYN